MEQEFNGSSNRPPFFNGTNFPYWKARMQAFLQAINMEVWDIVEEGYALPLTPVVGSTTGATELKVKSL